MGSLLLQQIPLALGIIMSPLAVVAVVAVLFSERARLNSIAYLIGWYLGIVVALAGSYIILTALQVHQRTHPPLWVPILHLVLGVTLLAGAWFVYTRSRRGVQAMAAAVAPGDVVAAAPQLPKMLQSVETLPADAIGCARVRAVRSQSHRHVLCDCRCHELSPQHRGADVADRLGRDLFSGVRDLGRRAGRPSPDQEGGGHRTAAEDPHLDSHQHALAERRAPRPDRGDADQ